MNQTETDSIISGNVRTTRYCFWSVKQYRNLEKSREIREEKSRTCRGNSSRPAACISHPDRVPEGLYVARVFMCTYTHMPLMPSTHYTEWGSSEDHQWLTLARACLQCLKIPLLFTRRRALKCTRQRHSHYNKTLHAYYTTYIYYRPLNCVLNNIAAVTMHTASRAGENKRVTHQSFDENH